MRREPGPADAVPGTSAKATTATTTSAPTTSLPATDRITEPDRNLESARIRPVIGPPPPQHEALDPVDDEAVPRHRTSPARLPRCADWIRTSDVRFRRPGDGRSPERFAARPVGSASRRRGKSSARATSGRSTARLAQRPVLQGDALDLHVDEPADPVLVGRVGPFRPRTPLGPGREVDAEGVGAVGEPVGPVDRPRITRPLPGRRPRAGG